MQISFFFKQLLTLMCLKLQNNTKTLVFINLDQCIQQKSILNIKQHTSLTNWGVSLFLKKAIDGFDFEKVIYKSCFILNQIKHSYVLQHKQPICKVWVDSETIYEKDIRNANLIFHFLFNLCFSWYWYHST